MKDKAVQITIWDILEQELTEQQKCDSDLKSIKCENCNCWKHKDIYNETILESEEKN